MLKLSETYKNSKVSALEMRSILVLAVLFLFGCASLEQPLTGSVTSYVKDSGSIDVHFCPQEDCEQLIIDFLSGAEESMYCALHDLGLDELRGFIEEQSQRVDVKVVMEDHYAKKAPNVEVVVDSGFGLMHNKFCVVDGKKVWTGSMNPTVRGATRNNNNIVFIESEVIASWYEGEFWELFEKKKNARGYGSVLLNDVPVSVYFCPEDECADKIVRLIRDAEESVHFLAFSFTHTGIANALLLKREAIEIRGVFEKTQLNDYTMFDVLEYQGLDVVTDGNPTNMHHKFFVIDSECVITGSMNPTKGGDSRNDENVLVICDESIAQQFEDEFEKVYLEATS
jgi:phosphatidylserine/phosphatidylglycerophosphate/cardiolipin synthase-like enzyme